MKVLLLVFLANNISAGIFYNTDTKTEPNTDEDSFEKSLNEGYDRLKNIRNEDDTVRFLKQLHELEKETNHYLTDAPEEDPDVMIAMETYAKIGNDHIQPMGDTIEEINHKNKVDAALFQGDMILTKTQADELLEDFKENEGIATKTTKIP